MERPEALTRRRHRARGATGRAATRSVDDLERRARRRRYASSTPRPSRPAPGERDIAAGVGDDLVALYEKIRAASCGIGAAELHQRRCEGCRLELNTADLHRIRARRRGRGAAL